MAVEKGARVEDFEQTELVYAVSFFFSVIGNTTFHYPGISSR